MRLRIVGWGLPNLISLEAKEDTLQEGSLGECTVVVRGISSGSSVWRSSEMVLFSKDKEEAEKRDGAVIEGDDIILVGGGVSIFILVLRDSCSEPSSMFILEFALLLFIADEIYTSCRFRTISVGLEDSSMYEKK